MSEKEEKKIIECGPKIRAAATKVFNARKTTNKAMDAAKIADTAFWAVVYAEHPELKTRNWNFVRDKKQIEVGEEKKNDVTSCLSALADLAEAIKKLESK